MTTETVEICKHCGLGDFWHLSPEICPASARTDDALCREVPCDGTDCANNPKSGEGKAT